MKQNKIQASYNDIPDKIIDAICYYLALYPHMSYKEICKAVKKALVKIQPTEELVEYIHEEEVERIDELAKGGVEAVNIGIALRKLPLATLHGRIELLHDIIHMGKNGYMEESMSPKGEMVELRKRDFRSALEAVKQLSGLMEVVEAAQSEADDTIYVDVYEHLKAK